jgi:hypothetical protein
MFIDGQLLLIIKSDTDEKVPSGAFMLSIVCNRIQPDCFI